MPQVAPVILPQLLKVIVQPEVYSARTRSRAVHIFNTISSFIFQMSYTFPVSTSRNWQDYTHISNSFSIICILSLSLSLQEAAKSLLLPVLLDYITAFVEILRSPLPSNSDDLLRKEVIMTLCQLLRYFPRPLHPHIMSIVTPVWNILISNTPMYPNNRYSLNRMCYNMSTLNSTTLLVT